MLCDAFLTDDPPRSSRRTPGLIKLPRVFRPGMTRISMQRTRARCGRNSFSDPAFRPGPRVMDVNRELPVINATRLTVLPRRHFFSSLVSGNYSSKLFHHRRTASRRRRGRENRRNNYAEAPANIIKPEREIGRIEKFRERDKASLQRIAFHRGDR